jgi:hypothetical protein
MEEYVLHNKPSLKMQFKIYTAHTGLFKEQRAGSKEQSEDGSKMVCLTFFTFHFSFLIFLAFPAQHGNFIHHVEAEVAHPFAAFFAKVKLHEGVHIRPLKGEAVFFPPHQRPGFLMLDGQAACLKRFNRASPFLPADVAEKAETKAVFVRMVNYFPGQRFTHIFQF